MLHDPSHYSPMPLAEEIKLGPRDKDILRKLAPNGHQQAVVRVQWQLGNSDPPSLSFCLALALLPV